MADLTLQGAKMAKIHPNEAVTWGWGPMARSAAFSGSLRQEGRAG